MSVKFAGHSTVYQVRIDRGETPWDVIYSLTHTVWKTVTRPQEMRKLEPLRWPDLYLSFRKVFEKRLVCFEQCGAQPWCGKSPARVLWRDGSIATVPPSVYLLEVQGDIERFVSGLCALSWKCVARAGQIPSCGKASWRDGVSAAVRQVLKSHLFFSEKCANCPLRRDARGWKSW